MAMVRVDGPPLASLHVKEAVVIGRDAIRTPHLYSESTETGDCLGMIMTIIGVANV